MNTYTLSTKGALEVNSSGGKLLKWKVGDKFIKTSTLDITQMTPKFMYESYAEVIAYHIAKWLGFNCVKYELCNVILDGNMQTIACESEDFTQSNEQYTSIGKLMAEDSIPTIYQGSGYAGYTQLVTCMGQYIPSFKEYLDKNIILDYIILNEDRHFGNFGIIRDSQGNMSLPPIFDNGNSCFCHKHVDGLRYGKDIHAYVVFGKPFIKNLDIQIKLVSMIYYVPNPNIKTYIKRLLNKLITQYGLPEQRGEFIYQMLIDRIYKLNKIKKSKVI